MREYLEHRVQHWEEEERTDEDRLKDAFYGDGEGKMFDS